MRFSFIISFLVRILAAFSALAMHVCVAKLLPINEAGKFYTAFTIVTLLSVFCRFGLDEVVLKRVSSSWYRKNLNEINSIYKTAIVYIFRMTFPCIFILASISFILKLKENDIGEALFYISPSLLFFSLYFIHAQMLQGRLETIKSTLVLGLISQLLFGIIVIVLKVSTANQACIVFDLTTFAALLAGRFFWIKGVHSSWRQVPCIDMKSSCIPLWIVMIVQQTVMWGGQIISTIYVSQADLAVLNFFQRMTTVLQFFLLFASLIFSPKIAAYYDTGQKSDLQNIVAYVNRYLFVISTAIFCIGFLCSFWVLEVFDSYYAQHSNVFLILLFGQAINTAFGFSIFVLTMCGKEKSLRDMALTTLPAIITTNFVLIKLYGIEGAAMASVLGILMQNIFAITVVRKRIGLSFYKL